LDPLVFTIYGQPAMFSGARGSFSYAAQNFIAGRFAAGGGFPPVAFDFQTQQNQIIWVEGGELTVFGLSSSGNVVLHSNDPANPSVIYSIPTHGTVPLNLANLNASPKDLNYYSINDQNQVVGTFAVGWTTRAFMASMTPWDPGLGRP
jgi:hypothetical protein